MSEFWMVACRTPLPTIRSPRFVGEHFRRGFRPRVVAKDARGTSIVYNYLGTTEIPDDEFSLSLWLADPSAAVTFKTLDDAEAAAFLVCTKHPHFLGCLEVLSYSG